MLGLEYPRAVVDVLSEHRLGFVRSAEVPEESPQAFGRVESDRVVRTKLVAALIQVLRKICSLSARRFVWSRSVPRRLLTRSVSRWRRPW